MRILYIFCFLLFAISVRGYEMTLMTTSQSQWCRSFTEPLMAYQIENNPNALWFSHSQPTDNRFGSSSIEQETHADLSPIKINEIQVANIDQYMDNSLNYGSWIELYNASDNLYTLSDVQIRHTDSKGLVQEYTLNQSHGVISPYGYACLFFDHHSANGNYGERASLQIPFKMDVEGGVIEILDTNSQTIDKVHYPPSIARCSYARVSDAAAEWGWTANVSILKSNNGSSFTSQRLSPPVISNNSCLFMGEMEFNVEIPQGTTLRYTTDGSTPSASHGKTATSSKFSVSSTTIFRFVLVAKDKLPSPVVTRSFIENTKDLKLPVLSVSSHPDHFFGDSIGVYVKGVNGIKGNGQSTPCNWNMDWERPVNVEYLVREDSVYQCVLNQEAEFSIVGGHSRAYGGGNGWVAKPSFRIKAAKQYEGKNSLNYPFFSENKKYNKHKAIHVRNGGNDTYARIKDPIIHEIFRTSGFFLECLAWQPAHVFINGEYLGMLNIRENSNRYYAAGNYGIDDDEIDQFEINWQKGYEQKRGDRTVFWQWLQLSKQIAQDPSNQTVWDEICQLVNVEEFCNYMAAECYVGSSDWLLNNNNVKGFRSKSDNGRFHLVMFDTDAAFYNYNLISYLHNMLNKQNSQYADNNGVNYLVEIFFNMLAYEPFKQQFIQTFSIVDGSVMNPERCKKIVNDMVAKTSAALELEGNSLKHSSAWMLNRIITPSERETRMNNVKIFFNLDKEYQLQIDANIPQAKLLLNGLEIPTNRFDGTLYPPISLSTKAPLGYTFKGWQISGEAVETKESPLFADSLFLNNHGVAPSLATSSLPTILDSSSFDLSNQLPCGKYQLKAIFEEISEPVKRFEIGATPVCINEVSAGNRIYVNDYFKRNDWIELYNTTSVPFDVTGMYISNDCNNPQKYQIPQGDNSLNTIIPPFGYLLIWCDNLLPINQLHAPFKLDNADGAYLVLQAEDGTWADEMTYLSQNRWQTYGRFPDGGEKMCLMDKPSIGFENKLFCQGFASQYEPETPIEKRELAITLALEKGWNWISHNLAEEFHLSRFSHFAQTVKGQNEFAEKDSVRGWEGDLTVLRAAAGYKILMNQRADITLRGTLYDTKNCIHVEAGWNWMGLPLYNETRLETALADYLPNEGDAILGITGFSTYEEGVWKGSLTSLSPGQLYLMKCGTAQDFCWNSLANPAARVRSYEAPYFEAEFSPWQTDIHAYSDVMNIIIQLPEAYRSDNFTLLGAFVDNECRGVAFAQEDYYYLTVHGEVGEKITFSLLDKDGKSLKATQTLTFAPQEIIGSRKNPFALTFNQTGISIPAQTNGKVVSTSYYQLNGWRAPTTPPNGVYIKREKYQNGQIATKKVSYKK